MKKEATTDLAKFEKAKKVMEEAKRTIEEAKNSILFIQNLFCEMVLDEIDKNSVLESEFLHTSHTKYSVEVYSSVITVCDTPVCLYFCVFPKKDDPDLSSDFILMNLRLDCSLFELSNRLINPRKNITLHFADTRQSMLIQCKKPVGN